MEHRTELTNKGRQVRAYNNVNTAMAALNLYNNGNIDESRMISTMRASLDQAWEDLAKLVVSEDN